MTTTTRFPLITQSSLYLAVAALPKELELSGLGLHQRICFVHIVSFDRNHSQKKLCHVRFTVEGSLVHRGHPNVGHFIPKNGSHVGTTQARIARRSENEIIVFGRRQRIWRLPKIGVILYVVGLHPSCVVSPAVEIELR